MDQLMLNLRSWPQAVLHIDGDAFFTSCEEAIHPELRGKPLITGGERGIVACASYAAKALGIRRGVSLHEAKKICPGLIVLPSDYETYSLFSRRMYNIVRRFTPQVEEYSLDEAFADLTGLRRCFHASYEAIALNIKREVERELGITVSAGLSLSKVLAKVPPSTASPRASPRSRAVGSPSTSGSCPWRSSGGSDPPRRTTSGRWGSGRPWSSRGSPRPW